MKELFRARTWLTGGVVVMLFAANPAANHSWGNYHWGTTTGVATIKTGDNVDSRWDAYLIEAIGDWNVSGKIELVKVPGGTSPKACRPTSGQIEACNARYGNTGWLGIAQIWASGSHIVQGLTKLNDTYFDTATYNTPAWRRMVTCQEIAHDFGLGHQDETFDNANLGSCMDYTNDPDGGAGGASSNDPSNEHPNSHDFDQLISIYNHKDSSNTASMSIGNAGAAPEGRAEWGRLIHSSPTGRVQVFERDYGNGNRVITHVFWADPEGDARAARGEN
jgi:hypothetical protein